MRSGIQGKPAFDEKQQLLPHFRNVTKSWELMKDRKEYFGATLNMEYFVRRRPNHYLIFKKTKIQEGPEIIRKAASEENQDFLSEHIFVKHGMAVMNFLEAVIEFINGNEDSKPVLYALGRSHKDHNVTEKMFVEMKNALVEIIRIDLPREHWKSWDVTLEYIYLNYIFKGMHMKSPLNMELK